MFILACIILTALNAYVWFNAYQAFDYRRNLVYQRKVVVGGHEKAMFDYNGMLVESARMVNILRKREARANARRITKVGWAVLKREKLVA